METVEISSAYGRTHVNVCGPADGPPLVLLAGGGATSTAWFANLAQLSRTYRVYAPDLIGDVGRSVPAARRLKTRADLMDWLDGVVAHTGDRAGAAGRPFVRRLDRPVLRPAVTAAGGEVGPARPDLLFHRDVPGLPVAGGAVGAAAVSETPAAPDVLGDRRGGDQSGLGEPGGAGAEIFTSTLVRPIRPGPSDCGRARSPRWSCWPGVGRCHDIESVRVNARRLMPQVSTAVLADVSHHGLPMRHA